MINLKKFFPYFSFLLFLLVVLFVFLYMGLQKRTSWPTKAGEEKVQLWLLPTKVRLRQGEETEVKVFLVSKEKEIGGVDLILKYEPALIEIVGNTIKPGIVFDYYRDRIVDNRRGIIRLSSSGKFKGEGTFATFSIKGKEVGSGKIEIVTPKVSVDSTVIWDSEEQTNLLGNVYNLSFEIY
jgi:hypothetical protein